MVGRDVSRFYHRTPHTPGETVVSVSQLRTKCFPQRGVSFELRPEKSSG